MKIYDPEFQPEWILPELRGKVIQLEAEEPKVILVPTTFGNIYCTEEDLDKYSKESDNGEE